MNTPARQHVHAPFPSREERERIMGRRARLMRALIDALVARDIDPQQADAQIGTLVADYGAADLEWSPHPLLAPRELPTDNR